MSHPTKPSAPVILAIDRDKSIPWFEQVRKTVQLPHRNAPEVYFGLKPPDYVNALVRLPGGDFLILREYRPLVEQYVLALLGGHVDPGETPEQAVVRELSEEMHCEASLVRSLGSLIPDSARLENRLWAFYIEVGQRRTVPSPHNNDGIEVLEVSPVRMSKMIQRSEFIHALDLAVVSLAIFHGCFRLPHGPE